MRPDQVPDFIGLKGDTSDNIPGVPGIGDKTAGQLIAQLRLARGGDRARRRALAGALARDHRARRPGARLEGARDDAPRPRPRLRPGRARARAARPLAAEGDLPPLRVPRRCCTRVDTLDEALPAAPLEVTGVEVPWREGELDFRGVVGYAAARRPRRRRDRRRGRRSARGPATRRAASSSCTTRRRSASTPRDDTLLAAYLIDPGRADVRARRPRPPSTGSSSCPSPRPTRRRRRSSSPPSCRGRLAPLLLGAPRGAQPDRALPRRSSCRSPACSPTWSAPA